MMSSNPTSSTLQTASLALGSALGGALLYSLFRGDLVSFFHSSQSKTETDPETDPSVAQNLVWSCIGGSLQANMMYIGDKLGLYKHLMEGCHEPGSSMTATQLAKITGFNQRWLREWLAQQAAMGVLQLLPGTGDDDDSLQYRIPRATAQVMADPDSPDYDISMIALMPTLAQRARTMVPEAFETGIGRPYDDEEVSLGIDRHHAIYIRDVFLPKLLPLADNAVSLLQEGCQVADLGCGGGNLLIALAEAFPKSKFHGYEVSQQALTVAALRVAEARLSNIVLHDANVDPLGGHVAEYDIITTYDVLHDAPNPTELTAQVKRAIKPNNGLWILGDIPCENTVRENITCMPTARNMYAFSTCKYK